MGVTHLWQILQPVAKPIKIADLKDKIIAVDLSIWICENSTFKHGSQILTKPHLRNLFFRCKHLLEIGCTLVFIREGDVIELKRDTMEKRNNIRFGYSSKKQTDEDCLSQATEALSLAASKAKPKKRSNFDIYINECCELLNYNGIAVIRSPCGEAEKSCAYLNLIGKCDAVISEDSDVFLYGAKTVYRNFCVDKKSEISIEEYSMSDIRSKLGYTREMLVAFGLFLGCDYDPKGVPGCGVQMANKFFNEILEIEKKECRKIDVLDLIRKWQSNDYEGSGIVMEEKIRRLVKNNIDHTFPNEKIIQEYLFMEERHKIILASEFDCNYKWRRPNLLLNQRFNEIKQAWDYKYTAEKIISLIILYENNSCTRERSVKPIAINKTRKHAHNDYYEVRWSKMCENNPWCDRDISELSEYVTLEKPDLFEIHFPKLVDEFKETLSKKKTTKKTTKKKTKETNEAVETEVVKNDVEEEEEDEICSQVEIKKVTRDCTIIISDDDTDTSDDDVCSEPIEIQAKNLVKRIDVEKKCSLEIERNYLLVEKKPDSLPVKQAVTAQVAKSDDEMSVKNTSTNTTDLVASFVESFLSSRKAHVNVEKEKLTHGRIQKEIIENDNDDGDDLIILSSSDDEIERDNVKNVDIQNLLDKFSSFKLESTRKPTKKNVEIPHIKPKISQSLKFTDVATPIVGASNVSNQEQEISINDNTEPLYEEHVKNNSESQGKPPFANQIKSKASQSFVNNTLETKTTTLTIENNNVHEKAQDEEESKKTNQEAQVKSLIKIKSKASKGAKGAMANPATKPIVENKDNELCATHSKEFVQGSSKVSLIKIKSKHSTTIATASASTRIEVNKENEANVKRANEEESTTKTKAESPLPFHLRMKQHYKDASIFKN